MAYKDKHLWRVVIPTADGTTTMSVLVYKWKTYGDETGKELIDKYGGERILKVEKKLDNRLWKWLKQQHTI